MEYILNQFGRFVWWVRHVGGNDPIINYTFWLVVVSAFQGLILFFTLRATNKSANAAKESADAFMVSQRAQLIPKVLKPIPNQVGHELQVVIELHNLGLTPAYSCTYQTWIQMLPVPFVDFTDAADHAESPSPATVYSNGPVPTSVTIVRH